MPKLRKRKNKEMVNTHFDDFEQNRNIESLAENGNNTGSDIDTSVTSDSESNARHIRSSMKKESAKMKRKISSENAADIEKKKVAEVLHLKNNQPSKKVDVGDVALDKILKELENLAESDFLPLYLNPLNSHSSKKSDKILFKDFLFQHNLSREQYMEEFKKCWELGGLRDKSVINVTISCLSGNNGKDKIIETLPAIRKNLNVEDSTLCNIILQNYISRGKFEILADSSFMEKLRQKLGRDELEINENIIKVAARRGNKLKMEMAVKSREKKPPEQWIEFINSRQGLENISNISKDYTFYQNIPGTSNYTNDSMEYSKENLGIRPPLNIDSASNLDSNDDSISLPSISSITIFPCTTPQVIVKETHFEGEGSKIDEEEMLRKERIKQKEEEVKQLRIEWDKVKREMEAEEKKREDEKKERQLEEEKRALTEKIKQFKESKNFARVQQVNTYSSAAMPFQNSKQQVQQQMNIRHLLNE